MNAPGFRGNVTLDDKFNVQSGWIYLTGTQALTRLPVQQAIRDKAAGLNTGGFISGYRGSPLGRYDMELWAQKKLLERHNIHFMPGVNEELAATSVWGAQYVGAIPGATVDGVFSIWYGKGPGTDRAADSLRHLGVAGSNKNGGVLAIAGDDHGVKSSTVYNFSDPIFIAAGMPVLYPSNTQELLELGLHGFALSRFSGCAVGFKVHNDIVEGGGSVYIGPDAPAIVLPDLPAAPELGPEGRNLRIYDPPLGGEERLVNHRLPAAIAYARANNLNYMVQAVPEARLGILSAGKSFQDVMQALAGLNLSEDQQKEYGVRVGKAGMIWPLDPEFIREFAAGLETIIVVEEKRGILEDQLKGILYDLALPNRPRIIGKYDGANAFAPERGDVVFQGWGELSSTSIGHIVGAQLRKLHSDLSNILPAPTAPRRAVWGRRAAVGLAAVEKVASASVMQEKPKRIDMSRDAVVARSVAYLTDYQDAAYAARYKALVDRALAAEKGKGLDDRFSTAVARYYFKLLAIKDEFEVARLYASDTFRRELAATFEGDYKVRFNVGAWPFAGVDENGRPTKKEVGPWLMSAFGLLKNFKGLRGTMFDPFRNNAERKLALRLLADYEAEVTALIAGLDKGNVDTAVALASLPEKIRGYGHVREQHVAAVESERAAIKATRAIAA